METLKQVLNVVRNASIVDVLDIIIVSFLIYELIMLARKTRAVQLTKGIVLLLLGSFVATNLQMRVLSNILSAVLQFGVLALVVVFQPEIRRVLEQIGHSHIVSLDIFRQRSDSEERRLRTSKAIAAVCDAAEQMSASRTGALIVFERKSNLSEILATGTVLNADVTTELLNTIFYEGTLLHDGATVIRDGRIHSAACVLPLSANLEISKEMGTRHRAALGMSENSDAVVVVVSEESGIVSLAKNGVLIRRLDRAALYKILTDDVLSLYEPSEKEKARMARGRHAEKKQNAKADADEPLPPVENEPKTENVQAPAEAPALSEASAAPQSAEEAPEAEGKTAVQSEPEGKENRQ